MAKVIISYGKKNLYFFLFGIGVIILFGFVMAYNSDFPSMDANPAVFGHSPDEIVVTAPSGLNMTLQTAIDGSEFGGWRKSGSFTFFDGNVGIGTLTPTTGKLVVSGGNIDVSS